MLKTSFCVCTLFSSVLYAEHFCDATLTYRGGHFEEVRKNFDFNGALFRLNEGAKETSLPIMPYYLIINKG